MTTDPLVLDMLGDDIKDAVLAAQTRLSDTTIMARCSAGLWLVERAGVDVATGLTHDAALAELAGLS